MPNAQALKEAASRFGRVVTAKAYANWQEGHNLRDPNDLYGVAAASADEAWAVGASGTIVYTRDGGTTWRAQRSGTDNTLRGVAVASRSVVWAVGHNATILKGTPT